MASRLTPRIGLWYKVLRALPGITRYPVRLAFALIFFPLPMNIEKNKVVTFHYTVFEANGDQAETSRDREPLTILYGAGNIIPGLEKALDGKAAGDHVEVTVAPEEGYGPHQQALLQRVPKKHFGKTRLVPGQMLMAQTQQGSRPLKVIKVGMSVVDVDFNHPMAGKTLRFEVDIEAVRDATEDEIAHGHAHGPDGHGHETEAPAQAAKAPAQEADQG